jgi:hypothetical protein
MVIKESNEDANWEIGVKKICNKFHYTEQKNFMSIKTSLGEFLMLP